MAETANEQLQDALTRHQIFMLRYSSKVSNDIARILAESEQDIAEKILARVRSGDNLRTSASWKRYNALMEIIAKIRGDAWEKAIPYWRKEMLELATTEGIWIDKVVGASVPVQLETVLPSAELMRALVTQQPFQGRTLRQWAASMKAADLQRIQSAIQLGMTAGEPADTIARRVIGTKRLNGADGVANMTRNQIKAVIRTAVNHITGGARDEYVRANSDIIQAEVYAATLDSRTTPVCRAHDGKKFKPGEGPKPPLHFNCRSLRVPYIDDQFASTRPQKPVTERQLLKEYAEKNNLGKVTSRAGLPYGTKGAFDAWARKRTRQLVGQVPSDLNYAQWLARQSKEFQEEVLGVTKAKLFRTGKLPLDRFVDHNGGELSLAELAKKEKAAFKAAGLDPAEF